MKFQVHRRQLIGFVHFHLVYYGRYLGRAHISESSELVEMSTECISTILNCKIAGGNPRPSLYEIVLLVECGSGEIIVTRMHTESIETVDRAF